MVQLAGQCFLKPVFQGRFSLEAGQPGSCSQCESWLVCSVLVAEQEAVLGIALAKGLCLHFWQHG